MQKNYTLDIVSLDSPQSLKIGIVQSTYHQDLTDNLVSSCTDVLNAHQIEEDQITVIQVPGTWEIPLAVQRLLDSAELDAVIVFGILVKGETYHFDLIADEVARALMELSLSYNVPVAFEILAVYELSQAVARASRDNHNKGIEGAQAMLKTIAAFQKLTSQDLG